MGRVNERVFKERWILGLLRLYEGFSEDEMANVIDHRYVRALNDARKWRQLQANKVKAKEKGSNVKPVVKAGAKRRTDGVTATRRKQEAKAMKSGNIADMADLLINPKL